MKVVVYPLKQFLGEMRAKSGQCEATTMKHLQKAAEVGGLGIVGIDKKKDAIYLDANYCKMLIYLNSNVDSSK